MNVLRTLFVACSVSVAIQAQAHYVWLEYHDGALGLHFGEYESGVFERSPGRLDDIGTPALRQGEEPPTEGQAGTDVWAYRRTGAGPVVAEVYGHPVRDWRAHGIGVVKPVYFARLSETPATEAPLTTLDVVPAGKPGEFIVYFRQAPLSGSAVTLHAPNGWSREGKTDQRGRIRFSLPWRGQYILEATHRQSGQGQDNGVEYEAIRYRATLSYLHDRGEETFRPEKASTN